MLFNKQNKTVFLELVKFYRNKYAILFVTKQFELFLKCLKSHNSIINSSTLVLLINNIMIIK